VVFAVHSPPQCLLSWHRNIYRLFDYYKQDLFAISMVVPSFHTALFHSIKNIVLIWFYEFFPYESCIWVSTCTEHEQQQSFLKVGRGEQL